jgi:hypothetical protein
MDDGRFVAEQWMAAQVQLKPTTRARHEVALRRQILPTWQDISLSAVSYAEIGAWVQRLTASGLAPASERCRGTNARGPTGLAVVP